MNRHINKRHIVRLIVFPVALLLTLSVLCFSNVQRANAAELKLEYQYLKSLDNLGDHMENIDSTLLKIMYSSDSNTMTALSSKLWREAGFAKENLSNLPISYLELENTYKFLSQVGDYSVSLSRKVTDGEKLTNEDRENLEALKGYSETFLEEILVIQDGVQKGDISFTKVKEGVEDADDETDAPSTSIDDTFLEFEEGFTSYPTLIYDGPFSDNVMTQEPKTLDGKEEIAKEEAREIALKATGLDSISDDYDEDGSMPSYCFAEEGISIAITKNGGYLNYMMKSRTVENASLSEDECVKKANEFLKEMGMDSMEKTYFEIRDGILTINYAAVQDGVMLYPDLIKVSVAMDNGEIINYDARGYLVNHEERKGLKASITADSAQQNLSPLLTVEKSNLVVIPSDGTSEKFCYEFKCTSQSGDDVLVYVNAKTGQEEQILILYIDENGSLTI